MNKIEIYQESKLAIIESDDIRRMDIMQLNGYGLDEIRLSIRLRNTAEIDTLQQLLSVIKPNLVKEKKKRTLYLKPVSAYKIEQEWNTKLIMNQKDVYYARCNQYGTINWSTTLIYREDELKTRNYKIII